MEKVKPPLTPMEQLVENYSLSLGVYQRLVTQGGADNDFLSIVSESIDEAKKEVHSLIDTFGSSDMSSSSQTVDWLNSLFIGRLDLDEAKKDPFFEDFLFSFPYTFRDAFGIKDETPLSK